MASGDSTVSPHYEGIIGKDDENLESFISGLKDDEYPAFHSLRTMRRSFRNVARGLTTNGSAPDIVIKMRENFDNLLKANLVTTDDHQSLVTVFDHINRMKSMAHFMYTTLHPVRRDAEWEWDHRIQAYKLLRLWNMQYRYYSRWLSLIAEQGLTRADRIPQLLSDVRKFPRSIADVEEYPWSRPYVNPWDWNVFPISPMEA
ncbi:hypothetical protein F5X98DRAFT_379254 [Xylaria grammica]|nr:hypothetical protein F5X98DRAFT_379254 [Xylaria grammica]